MAPRNPMNIRPAAREEGTVSGAAQDLGLQSISPDVRCRTAHEFVCRVLRQGILSGQLPGGTRLVQTYIAAELGMSTTPVREALRDLVSEGIIRLDAHRGAVVREIDISDVREVYELRKLLEPFAVRHAVKLIAPEQLNDLADLCHRMEDAEDPAEWLQLNREFHTLLIEEARRPRLTAILKSLADTVAAFVALAVHSDPRLPSTAWQEHTEILDALRRGDADRASDVTRQHLESTLDALEELSQRAPAETQGVAVELSENVD